MNRIACFLIAALLAGSASAQRSESGLPLFADDAPLKLRITAPFNALSRDRGERTEHDASVEVLDGEAVLHDIDVEIRVRGRSRLALCSFPPLSIDFDRDAPEGSAFEGQNRIKLVTVCKHNRSYRRYLTQEFQIYRMLNELTDTSFRVRWAEVEYVWNDSRRPESIVEPAFFIEEDWEVADRLGLETISEELLSFSALDSSHTALLMMFQYLIANTDMAMTRGPPGDNCCHNGKPIGSADGAIYVLPYDFDNAGLISTDYAVPNAALNLRSVTQRMYRGFCAHNDELGEVIAHLNANRAAMEAILDDPSIRDNDRRRALRYFAESFERINEPSSLQRDLIGECRD